jgi:hypothetical protein
MVFQQFNLFPHLTVLENLTLSPMWVGKMPKKEAEEKAMAQLKRVRIAEQAGKYPLQLSGGQQQRVAIARALCLTAQDHAVRRAHLGARPRDDQGSAGRDGRDGHQGITMLCVTHEMGFAKAVADRVIFMDQGQIVEQNNAARLLQQPAERTQQGLPVQDPGALITAGTLYQKRFCAPFDWRTGAIAQFLPTALLTFVGAWLTESFRVEWTGELLFAMGWLVLVLSIGAISLLNWLIRHSDAVNVASLFYLVPPCTALVAWLLFDEAFTGMALAGMALTVWAVYLARK